MLDAGIIEEVEESKWIIPKVVWVKKTGGIRIHGSKETKLRMLT
jgi:hypothetical protein